MSIETFQDKRAAVLNAALELISKNGFHGTPMSQVAQEANVGVGTIYRYFASKEDLINALYTDLKTQFTQAILAGYSPDLPIRARFTRILENLANYFSQHPKELRFMEQYSNSPFINDQSRQEGIRMLDPIKEFFNYGQEQQIIKPVPAAILMQLVYGGIISLVKLNLAGSLVLDETNLGYAIDALWDAVKR